MTFEEIIDTVSAKDATHYQGKNPIRDSIALVGRLVAEGHAGWDDFSPQLQLRFKSQISNLYNNPPENQEDTLKKLEEILLRSVPDNHIAIMDEKSQSPLSEADKKAIQTPAIDKYPQGHVGTNIVFNLENDKHYKTLFLKKYDSTEAGHTLTDRTEAFGIFETRRNGQTIGVIALSRCPQPEKFAAELTAFNEALQKYSQNWDSLVVDVRGNPGGNSTIIENICTHLCGNPIQLNDGFNMRLTPEARLFQESNMQQRIQNANAAVATAEVSVNAAQSDEERLNAEQHLNSANATLINETRGQSFLSRLYESGETSYEMISRKKNHFNKQKGFTKPIHILTDRQTGSSAEYICRLDIHPNAQFIGENTHGCGTYGNVGFATLPCGGRLMMGTQREYSGIIEGAGHTPDIYTPAGKDAFEQALLLIDNVQLLALHNKTRRKEQNH